MTMLPDVTQSDWNGYQADEFSGDANRRISSLGFASAADQRISDLNANVPPVGPTSSDSLTNPIGSGNAPQPQLPPDLASTNPTGLIAQPDVAPAPAPRSLITQPGIPSQPDSTPPASSSASSVMPSAPPGRGVSASSDLVAAALNAADEAGVDPQLFVALVNQESSFNPTARSPVGAMGLTQLMPETARGLGVSDPFDVQQSLRGGARYLRQMLDNNGGDAVKALAAYNAGQGNLDKYGINGLLDPSFARGETLKYVDNIMSSVAANQGGVGTATNTPSGGPQLVPDVTRPAGTPSKDISQFGDPQLTAQEAYAACGPAAAVRFAEFFGRNPTLREATDLAKQVGWTPQQGMAGLGSEKALMDRLPDPVPTKLVNGADWQTFANEAQTGNPIIISTAGHYFTADGYNPQTGAFHVGRSGLDLKGGAEWMTPAQMTSLMGPVQGGLLADNPQVPQPSTADQQSNPIDWLGKQKDALASGIGNAVQGASDAVGNAGAAVAGAASSLFPMSDVTSAQPASMQLTPSDSLTNPLGTGNASRPPAAPPAGPLDVVKQKFSDALDALGGIIGGATTAAASSTNPQVTTPTLPSVSVSNTGPGLVSASSGVPSSPTGGLAEAVPTEGQTAPAFATGVSALARGPLLRTDEELLAGASLQDLANARQQAVLAGITDPTPADLAASLRAQQLGYAYAGTHTDTIGMTQPSTRMFHGTGSDFARPEPGRFDANGLFGPGYYLTDSPEVAGGTFPSVESHAAEVARLHAEADALEAQGALSTARMLRQQADAIPRPDQYTSAGYAQQRTAALIPIITPEIRRTAMQLTDLQGRLAQHENIGPGPGNQMWWNGRRAQLQGQVSDAQARLDSLQAQLSQPTVGPNVRAVDVPQNLNLLNVDASAEPRLIDRVYQYVEDISRPLADRFLWNLKNNRGPQRGWTNNDVYQEFSNALEGEFRGTPNASGEINTALAGMGYDGIRYAGGQRIPMQDAAGAPIEHNAVVIFPQSLDKLRNAISGTQGGQASVPFATSLGGRLQVA
jgi:hypothetical protein